MCEERQSSGQRLQQLVKRQVVHCIEANDRSRPKAEIGLTRERPDEMAFRRTD